VATLVDMDPAIGSGRAQEGYGTAFARFDDDPAIRAILVNAVTCGYRLDEIVTAMLQALAARPRAQAKPVILHLRGNAATRTPQLLADAGCENSASLAAAIGAVIRAAGA
jgi:succinyl-CoA synthetase beta subunit